MLSMAIAETAALHNEMVDRVVRQVLWFGGWVFTQTRALLPLQELHSNVGHLQLVLGFCTVRIHC